MPTARTATTPPARPMTMAARLFTKPHAGVMATSPATAPDAAPSVVACPVRSFSTTTQPNSPAQAASWVPMNACAAQPLAASAGPENPPPRKAVGGGRGAGVEAEPAEPQDSGAHDGQRKRVGSHRLTRP